MNKNLHIINYILNRTDPNSANTWSDKINDIHRKYKVDDIIKLCNICKKTWSRVPDWIDSYKYRRYPKGHVPTIGKKIKICPICKEEQNGKK